MAIAIDPQTETWFRPEWAFFPTTLIPHPMPVIGVSRAVSKGLKLPKSSLLGGGVLPGNQASPVPPL